MSTLTAPTVPVETREHYLNADYGIRSWLLTVDHKRIALLYLASITLFFFLGGFFAVLIRLELLTPQGDMVQAETYNKLFTMHGIIMIIFFLIPAIPAVLGNFLVPLMVGAKDLAFPRINLLSWYIYILGGIISLTSIVVGGVDTGWTFYTPYSSTYSNSYVITRWARHLCRGFLLHSDRTQFHRHHSQDAGTGIDMVPAAALHLGALRDQLSSRCLRRRFWRSRLSCWRWKEAFTSEFSIPPWAEIPFCSSTSSGSTRIRPCTS